MKGGCCIGYTLVTVNLRFTGRSYNHSNRQKNQPQIQPECAFGHIFSIVRQFDGQNLFDVITFRIVRRAQQDKKGKISQTIILPRA